jgi:hypothetical protein
MRIELNGNIIGEIAGRFIDTDLNEADPAAPYCWTAEAPASVVKILEAEGLRILFVRHEDNTLVVVPRK